MIVARKRINRVFYNWMLKSDVNHIVRVHDGLHIKIKLSDQACSSILCERRYSPAEARVFLRLASRCGSIIYVGANYGYFTLLALANSDPGCQVVAIGPNEVLAGMIEDSVALNEFEGVTVIVAAAGKENGVALFDVDESLSSSGYVGSHGVEVPLVSLDSIIEPNEGGMIVKIDVEGSEEAVLDGARGLLCESTVVMCELSKYTHDSVMDLLLRRGYEAYSLTGVPHCGPLRRNRIDLVFIPTVSRERFWPW